jgi:hypothetical protein
MAVSEFVTRKRNSAEPDVDVEAAKTNFGV